jgi:hypothetical protein
MATVGSKNQPIVQTTDTFNPVSDINTLSNWVANNYASVKVLTGATLHTAITGADLFAGLLAYETSTGQYWRYDGSAWNIEAFGTPPRAHLTKTTTQSIATGGTGTVVTTWTATMARGMTANASAGTITIPYTGRYNVYAQVLFAAAATGYRAVTVLQNGSAMARNEYTPASSANTAFVPVTITGYVYTAGDVLSLNALQTSGGAINVIATSTFIVEYVGQ